MSFHAVGGRTLICVDVITFFMVLLFLRVHKKLNNA